MAKVVNMYLHSCKGAVCIMRGTRWGNPFIVGKDGTRKEVVELFRRYAQWRLTIQPQWLAPLRGKTLKCCCAPQPCHGDVIVEILEEANDE